ncbi:DUF2949 domain-containing protein [Leptolyngbya sp. FACHB-261]|uniref:DUF2949 domain-containing protein n=1 Tax=Leptolyngbya sp. FACHB-261 TaxID=2692806 RepID=UPI0018EF5658|nr:DUF2949 domain-containing protein [Leptolyngbya sp. FACHB-261]
MPNVSDEPPRPLSRIEQSLLRRGILTQEQIYRAREIQQAWLGPLPMVLWQLGWIDTPILESLLDLNEALATEN